MRNIKKCDLFGRNIQILFNNERNHKTLFGGFVTLFLVVGFCIFVYIQYDQSQFPRSLVRNQVHVENAKMYDLNKVLNIAFGLQNQSYEHYIDESLYNIKGLHVTYNRSFNKDTGERQTEVKETEVKLEQCREDHFTIPETKDYFRSLNYQGMYCFSRDQNLPIEGDFDSERYSFIQLVVKQCENQPNCQPPDVINETYQYMNLALYFSDNFIQLSEKESPFVEKSQDLFVSSGIPLAKELAMYFQNTKVVDQGGFYNEQIDVQEKLTFDKMQEQAIPYIQGGYMFKTVIRHTKSLEVNVVRNFQPFSVLLSQLGGFYQFLIGIGCLMCYPVSQIDLNIKLINALFNIDQTQEEEELKSFSPKSIKEGKDDFYTENQKSNCFGGQVKKNKKYQLSQTEITQNQIEKNSHLKQKQGGQQSLNIINRQGTLVGIDDDNNIPSINDKIPELKLIKNSVSIPSGIASSPLFKNIAKCKKRINKQHSILGINGNIIASDSVLVRLSKMKDQIKQMQLFRQYFQVNSVQFSIWNFITLNLMCCKRYQVKRKQLNKSVSQLYSQLDVHNILQKLIEIDKIKMVILNDNQRKLFEYLPQPKIFAQSPIDENNQVKDGNQQINDQKNRINGIQNINIQLGVISQDSQNNIKNKNQPPNTINILYQNHKSLIEKAEDAWLALKELRSNPCNQTEVDKKLLQMIDPKIFEIFSLYNQADIQQEDSQLINPSSEVQQNLFTNNNLSLKKITQENASIDQINQEEQNNESSYPSLSKLGTEAYKKQPKQNIVVNTKKKSDFFLTLQTDQILMESINNEDNKQSNRENDEIKYTLDQNDQINKINFNDSTFPLSEKEEQQKEINYDYDNGSNFAQNDEFLLDNLQQLQENDINEVENNINIKQIKMSIINSTYLGLDLKANKLLSKIKSQVIKSDPLQQDIGNIPQLPAQHLISQMDPPSSPRLPSCDKEIKLSNIYLSGFEDPIEK